jgi:hypothetical protein
MMSVKYRKVPVSDLIVDDRYQRDLDERRVRKIVNEFDPALFGTLEVSHRNGVSAVFDGQHRLVAAAELGHESVPCLVHTGLSPEDEAVLFVQLQRERKGISAVQRFRARLFSGDEIAQEIAAIVDEAGFTISDQSSADAGRTHSIKGVQTLERLYHRGVLSGALGIIREVWYGDDKSTDAGFIEGVGLLLEQYGSRLDDDAFERLRAVPPIVVIRRAVGREAGAGGSKGSLIAVELRKVAGVRGRPSKPQKPTSAEPGS